jgi:hypothetical protein
MVVHACSPTTRESEAKDHKFQASLSYIVRRSHDKNKKRYRTSIRCTNAAPGSVPKGDE